MQILGKGGGTVLRGVVAGGLWILFLCVLSRSTMYQPSDDLAILTLAIVVAGGLAGGDK